MVQIEALRLRSQITEPNLAVDNVQRVFRDFFAQNADVSSLVLSLKISHYKHGPWERVLKFQIGLKKLQQQTIG